MLPPSVTKEKIQMELAGLSTIYFFFLMIRRPPRSTPYPTLFPYTTALPILNRFTVHGNGDVWFQPRVHMAETKHRDRKSTRLNSSHIQNLVCRLLLEKKKYNRRPICLHRIFTLFRDWQGNRPNRSLVDV